MNRRVFSDTEEKYTSRGPCRESKFNGMNLNVPSDEHRARIADVTLSPLAKEN